jgi:hypothetical protein
MTDTCARNILWSWRNAAFGVTISSVAAVSIALGHVENGLYLLIGMIPAAIIGLPPVRQERRKVLIVGILFGVSVVIGSALAQWAPLAVVGMFLIGFSAALLAAKKPIGFAMLTICLPLAGIGLTYTDFGTGVGVGLLFIVGSAFAFIAAMALSEYGAPVSPDPPLLSSAMARDFGLRLGLAAALGTALCIYCGAEYTGWIVGSTLLVMRPSDEMMELRGVGRAVSVFVGAVAAAWLLTLDLSPLAIAVVGAGGIIAMAATNASRWYVTPAFTTFLILWALLYEQASRANIEHRFSQRVLGTLLGIGIAYVFGFLVPKVTRRGTAQAEVRAVQE